MTPVLVPGHWILLQPPAQGTPNLHCLIGLLFGVQSESCLRQWKQGAGLQNLIERHGRSQ